MAAECQSSRPEYSGDALSHTGESGVILGELLRRLSEQLCFGTQHPEQLPAGAGSMYVWWTGPRQARKLSLCFFNFAAGVVSGNIYARNRRLRMVIGLIVSVQW